MQQLVFDRAPGEQLDRARLTGLLRSVFATRRRADVILDEIGVERFGRAVDELLTGSPGLTRAVHRVRRRLAVLQRPGVRPARRAAALPRPGPLLAVDPVDVGPAHRDRRASAGHDGRRRPDAETCAARSTSRSARRSPSSTRPARRPASPRSAATVRAGRSASTSTSPPSTRVYMYTVLRMRMTQEFNRLVPRAPRPGATPARRLLPRGLSPCPSADASKSPSRTRWRWRPSPHPSAGREVELHGMWNRMFEPRVLTEHTPDRFAELAALAGTPSRWSGATAAASASRCARSTRSAEYGPRKIHRKVQTGIDLIERPRPVAVHHVHELPAGLPQGGRHDPDHADRAGGSRRRRQGARRAAGRVREDLPLRQRAGREPAAPRAVDQGSGRARPGAQRRPWAGRHPVLRRGLLELPPARGRRRLGLRPHRHGPRAGLGDPGRRGEDPGRLAAAGR